MNQRIDYSARDRKFPHHQEIRGRSGRRQSARRRFAWCQFLKQTNTALLLVIIAVLIWQQVRRPLKIHLRRRRDLHQWRKELPQRRQEFKEMTSPKKIAQINAHMQWLAANHR